MSGRVSAAGYAVSILVLMDVVREVNLFDFIVLKRIYVSILVLMDVVREAPVVMAISKVCIGFNPCSNGCRSGRNTLPATIVVFTGVSILVLMDVVREGVQSGLRGSPFD